MASSEQISPISRLFNEKPAARNNEPLRDKSTNNQRDSFRNVYSETRKAESASSREKERTGRQNDKSFNQQNENKSKTAMESGKRLPHNNKTKTKDSSDQSFSSSHKKPGNQISDDNELNEWSVDGNSQIENSAAIDLHQDLLMFKEETNIISDGLLEPSLLNDENMPLESPLSTSLDSLLMSTEDGINTKNLDILTNKSAIESPLSPQAKLETDAIALASSVLSSSEGEKPLLNSVTDKTLLNNVVTIAADLNRSVKASKLSFSEQISSNVTSNNSSSVIDPKQAVLISAAEIESTLTPLSDKNTPALSSVLNGAVSSKVQSEKVLTAAAESNGSKISLLKKWFSGDGANGGALLNQPLSMDRKNFKQLIMNSDFRALTNVNATTEVDESRSPTSTFSQAVLSTEGGATSQKLDPSLPQSAVTLYKPGWQKGMTTQIQWMKNNGLEFADVKIDPEELGPIQIKIKNSQNEISVSIQVSHAQTKDLIEQNLQKMKDLLEESGLSLSHLDVSSQQSNEKESEQTAENKGNTLIGQNAGEEAGESDARQSTRETKGLLDYFV